MNAAQIAQMLEISRHNEGVNDSYRLALVESLNTILLRLFEGLGVDPFSHDVDKLKVVSKDDSDSQDVQEADRYRFIRDHCKHVHFDPKVASYGYIWNSGAENFDRDVDNARLEMVSRKDSPVVANPPAPPDPTPEPMPSLPHKIAAASEDDDIPF